MGYYDAEEDIEQSVLREHIKSYHFEAYKTKAGAAKALYNCLRAVAESWGQNPDIEVALLTPQQSERAGRGRNWCVMWEAGPYQWAIGASELVCAMDGEWYTEPYYSFDLCFTD